MISLTAVSYSEPPMRSAHLAHNEHACVLHRLFLHMVFDLIYKCRHYGFAKQRKFKDSGHPFANSLRR